MNAFTKFFTAFFAMFMGLFSATSKGYERKMNEHNQDAYQRLREKLHPYAKKFLLPTCKRDKNGVLIKNKRYLKYEKFIKEKKEQRLQKRGAFFFEHEGHVVMARDDKNAERKFANLGVYI